MLPSGVMGLGATVATGIIAASTSALVAVGDAVDNLIFATPLGAPPVQSRSPLLNLNYEEMEIRNATFQEYFAIPF